MDSLREQVMINQFVLAAGCARDQARQLLMSTRPPWQFESALSAYFEQASVGHRSNGHFSMIAPANTPATPPNFPETLIAFSKLSAGSDASRVTTSPPAASSYLNPANCPSSQFNSSSNPMTGSGPTLKTNISSNCYCTNSSSIPLTPSNH